MSFLNKIKPNKPVASLEGYFIAMHGRSKFGKTTFAVELAKEFYKGDMSKMLLLAPEIGYKTIAGVHAIPVTGFEFAEDEDDEEQRGFIEVVDELIENRDDVPYRFIIIDTITALERYANKYVVAKANIADKPKPRYSDISDILWGKGYNQVAEAIYHQINRLKQANFGVFIVGHEKTKKITLANGFEYDYTGFDIQGKTSSIIEREADIIIYGATEVSEGKNEDVITNRQLVFRSDGSILCGARFENFPETLENDASVFLKAFNNAILGLYDNDEKAVEKSQKEEKKAIEKKSKEKAEKKKSLPSVEELHDEIANTIGNLESPNTKEISEEFKEILGIVNYKKSDNAEKLFKALTYVKGLGE